MSDDGWGDLFAMAAGETPSGKSLVDEQVEKKSQSGIKKKNKKRKRNDAAFEEMLDSRLSLAQEGPINFKESNEWHIVIYRAVCNLRADALSFATGGAKRQFNKGDNLGTLSRIIFPPSLELGELSILSEKKNRLFDYASQKRATFATAVRIIISCDDLYLRLYYLQVSGALPLGGTSYLPHPVTHFDSLGKNLADSTSSDLSRLCDKFPHLAAYYGLDEIDHNPLSKIYQQRFIESHRLFKASLNPEETLEALNKQNAHPPTSLEYHATPAAHLLQEWRDSCRDVLCHLYCYATMSSSCTSALIDALQKMKVSRIIELGAGTGYMAKLLQCITVQAYDVDPTSSSFNEYHGRTHPFVDVRNGTHLTVFNDEMQSTALLLCYPPPQMRMAYNALKTFMDKGGSSFIHVGEWKGLTGSAEFEHLLQSNWCCVYRKPCLTWGTDAADVTVWIRGRGKEATILLPCMNCGKREATRRCRLLRHAAYCNRDCFESQQNQVFRAMCVLSLVPPTLPLDYDNDLHFQPLSQ